MCVSYSYKKWRGCTGFGKVLPWDAAKKFRLFRNWVWGVLPRNLCSHHGMSFKLPFCHLWGHVYTKQFIRYCSAFIIPWVPEVFLVRFPVLAMSLLSSQSNSLCHMCQKILWYPGHLQHWWSLKTWYRLGHESQIEEHKFCPNGWMSFNG